MKTNIATTREQSARLLQCRVSADTADMFYQTPITVSQKAKREDILLVKKADKELYDTDIPAWSLSALLGLLPNPITSNGRSAIMGLYHEEGKVGDRWNCSYPGIKFCIGRTPFEAIILMIEWLMENNYKLNEI